MGRSLRRAMAFDEVTGFHVAASQLLRDPETGLLTVDPDKPNGQKFIQPIPADGANRPKASGPNNRFDVSLLLGYGDKPLPSITIGNQRCYEVRSEALFVVAATPMTVRIGNLP